MKAFKNMHMAVAMIIAPILAILAWFAIDRMVGETPHAARQGTSYPLVEMPNCRYNSGTCGIKNNDFRLDLEFEQMGSNHILLSLESAFPLQGVKLAVAENGAQNTPPAEMRATDDSGMKWTLELPAPDPETSRLQLVASAQDTLYFGDVSTQFMLPR